MIEQGAAVPDVQVLDDSGAEIAFSSLLGRPLVLFFYPKDNTPGCTTEASGFRDLYPQFLEKGVEVIGVSRDSVTSHCNFKDKFVLPYRLLADVDSKLCDAFGVIVEKNNYGKKSMGVQRSTFLIDADGKVARVWPKVSVDGHAEAVLAAVS
jgi:peroxiredoxin Q/BCP